MQNNANSCLDLFYKPHLYDVNEATGDPISHHFVFNLINRE